MSLARGEQWPTWSLLALSNQPGSWSTLETDTLKDLVSLRCLGFGKGQSPEDYRLLSQLYPVVVDRAGREERIELASSVGRIVERMQRQEGITTGVGMTPALWPFLYDDPDPVVVSIAAFNVAALLPVGGEDPLAGIRRFVDAASDVVDKRRGAIYVGLLRLGDRRVLPLVEGCWRGLGREGGVLQLAAEGRPLATVVDFFLSWAEDLVERHSSRDLEPVLESLARVAEQARDYGEVIEVERRFSASEHAPDEVVVTTAAWSIPDFASLIAPRLGAICRAEADPKPVSRVLELWGVTRLA